jgi:hypothetical protein
MSYALHILEESNGFAGWVVGPLHGRISTGFFYLANAWFMGVLLLLTRLASRRRSRTAVGVLFFFASGQTFWDAVLHIYAENHFATYSPGFFTAVFLYLPVYGYLSYLALREGFLSFESWAAGLLCGLVLLAAIVWAGLYDFGPFPWALWA